MNARIATRRDPSATTLQLARDDHGIGCDVPGCDLEAVIAIGASRNCFGVRDGVSKTNHDRRAVRCQNHLTCAERL